MMNFLTFFFSAVESFLTLEIFGFVALLCFFGRWFK